MIYGFAGLTLNTDRMVLQRGDQNIPVEPQVFDILRVLAEHAGTLVTKDHLIEEVWGGRFVSDATISARINAARMAVGDTGSAQKVIRTVPRRGFELVAAVEETGSAPPDFQPEIRQTIRYTKSKDGRSIAWSSAGEGPPLVLAWHQFSHLETDWGSPLMTPILRRLASRFRLIRYDIRGSGLSDPIDEHDTVDTHVDDLIAVADAAELDCFSIVAVLQSAAIAAQAAARMPERFLRMVLWSAYARGRALRPGAPESAEHDPFIALLNSGGWGNPDNPFMRAWATMVLPGASHNETTDLILQIAHSGTTRQALLQRKLIDNVDVTNSLPLVKCPTLVIHPRLGALHPAAEGRRVAAGIQGAVFLELDSANTFPIPSDPIFEQQMSETLGFMVRE
ncbi:MAG: winged helix-turn-helix domain-containing protein [Rhodobacteraceae bacterium]|nr:winged helix-turn-helix domain-containing protein [Paracoccaceae bacterium]